MNDFLKAATNVAYTENGARSYLSTGSAFIDQFGKAGSYRRRSIDAVFADQEKLWKENKEFAVKFPFYLRMVTRKVKLPNGSTTAVPQRGQGVRDESFKRLLWFLYNEPEIFYQNLWLLPVVGSWKDLWVLLTMPTVSTDIDYSKVFEVIAEGVQSESQKDLVKKYMPQIRANKKCNTEWASVTNNLAKAFCKWAGWTAQEYRIFKSSGKAHEFQKFISQKRYDMLDWSKISGKALLNLATGKFLANQHLEASYLDWISTTPTAKFNGYPYELLMKLRKLGISWKTNLNTQDKISKMTIDAQFENLLKMAKEGTGSITGNVWCALDTSGSMGSRISLGSDLTAFDVCVSLGIYFSSLNEGAFNKNVIMFDDVSKVKQLSGSFTDMYQQILREATAWGSTNFQSVINEIIAIRRAHPYIPLEDFPTTLLVVSDMQFNPVGANVSTNYERAKKDLARFFPQEWVDNFKFIWWQVNGRRTTDMPATMDDGGCYFISGFDGSIVTMLLGGESQVVDEITGEKRTPTMEELALMAMNQEVLQLLKF